MNLNLNPDPDELYEAITQTLQLFIKDGRVSGSTEIIWDTIHQEFDEEKQDYINVVELTDGTEILVHFARKQ